MKSFFDYDGYLNQILTKVMYVVASNLLFLLCCIPIFTIGASSAAMYTVLLRFLQGDEPDILKTFFRAFRGNFKKATLVWIGMLAVAATLGLNYYLLYQMSGVISEGIRIFLNLILLIWIAFWIYLFPVMAYYENNVRGYVEFTIRAAVGQFPRTILLMFLQIVPLLGVLYFAQYVSGAVLVLICCGFSMPAYFSGKILIQLFENCERKEV